MPSHPGLTLADIQLMLDERQERSRQQHSLALDLVEPHASVKKEFAMRILSVLVVSSALCGCANQAQNIRPQPTQLSGYWESHSSHYEEHWFIQPDGTGASCSVPLMMGPNQQITSDSLRVAGDQIANGRATYAITQVSPNSFHARQDNGLSDFSFTREVHGSGACSSVLPHARQH